MKYYRYDWSSSLYRFDPSRNEWWIFETGNVKVRQWLPCDHKIYKINGITLYTPNRPSPKLINQFISITEREVFLEIL